MAVQRRSLESNFQEHGKLGEGEAHKGDIILQLIQKVMVRSHLQQVNGFSSADETKNIIGKD
jgi:hypothetical protein